METECANVPAWDLATELTPEVREAARNAARSFDYAISHEDLVQIGLLYIAEHPRTIRTALAQDGPDYARWAVQSELRRQSGRERGRLNRQVPYNDEWTPE